MNTKDFTKEIDTEYEQFKAYAESLSVDDCVNALREAEYTATAFEPSSKVFHLTDDPAFQRLLEIARGELEMVELTPTGEWTDTSNPVYFNIFYSREKAFARSKELEAALAAERERNANNATNYETLRRHCNQAELRIAELQAEITTWREACGKARERADDSAAEITRLRGELTKANAQAERFEREWYLRGGENEALVGRLTQLAEEWDEECYDNTRADEALKSSVSRLRKAISGEMQEFKSELDETQANSGFWGRAAAKAKQEARRLAERCKLLERHIWHDVYRTAKGSGKFDDDAEVFANEAIELLNYAINEEIGGEVKK